MLEENFVQNILAVHIRIKLIWQRSMYIRKMPDPDAFGLRELVLKILKITKLINCSHWVLCTKPKPQMHKDKKSKPNLKIIK